MIQTERWRKLRKQKLTSSPLCERCQEDGRVRAAEEVHHIRPVEDGLTYREKEMLMFDPHNLRALCHDCHVKTHTEMGRGGKEHVKRKNKEHLERFVRRFMDKTEAPGGVVF